MKYSTLSIIIGILGLILLIKFDLEIINLFQDDLTKHQIYGDLEPSIILSEELYRAQGFITGLAAFILGLIAISKKQRLGFLGIILSILLFILALVPVLDILLANSALDININ